MPRFAPVIPRLVVATAIWVCLGPTGAAAADRNATYLAALESIRADELMGHVEYLADDALEGREAGTAGGRKAAEYVAGQLEKLGLRGAGVDGGFFQTFRTGYRNVLARLEGSDPELKQQCILVGAHYDHVGYGTRRSSLGQPGRIHNGADDNASGTSGLLELARAFTALPTPPERSVLFAFWDAEEKRFLGSKHWVAHPTVPLDHVVALLNVDMIGRVRNDRLKIFGTRIGYGWRRLVAQSNEGPDLKLEFPWTTRADGDHWPFLDHRVPVLMFHNALHDDYHRPSDDAHLINAEGMRRATQLLFAVAHELATRSQVPAFRQAGRWETDKTLQPLAGHKPERPQRLGATWESGQPPEQGVCVTTVAKGSPAEKAGLEPGDRVVDFAGRPIRSLDELTWAVTAAENPATIVVQRSGQDRPLPLSVQLDGAPLRLGIHWRADHAEPGAVILTDVVPGSPAAGAGLRVGDHVYQIAGRNFADNAEFAELARTLSGPLELLIERDGQLRTVEIQLQPKALPHAA